ncbi:MAG: PH domain-containing protein [Phycisphaerae bacterium]
MARIPSAGAPQVRTPRGWPFFSTPLRHFLAVVGPIALLMGPLAWVAPRGWMRVSAGAVLAYSVYALLRGYCCRLTIDDRGLHYRGLMRRVAIPWARVRRIARYATGPAGAAYVYVTTRDDVPAGRWEIDNETIQLQDRAGLVEALEGAWRRACPRAET